MNAAKTVDLSGFNRQMQKLAALTGQPAQTVCKEEAMRFCRQLIKFTPPAVNKATAAALKANNPDFKNATVKRIATRAILGDLRRAVVPVLPDNPKHPLLKQAIEENRADLLQKFLDLPAGKVIGHVATNNIATVHQAARNRRGRVRRATGAATTDNAQWQKHYRNLQKRIGYMKAGWLKSWNKLATVKGWRKAPKMISRHAAYAKGGARLQSAGKRGISIIMLNRTPGIGVLQNAVNGAVRARTQAIARRVAKLIKVRK